MMPVKRKCPHCGGRYDLTLDTCFFCGYGPDESHSCKVTLKAKPKIATTEDELVERVESSVKSYRKVRDCVGIGTAPDNE